MSTKQPRQKSRTSHLQAVFGPELTTRIASVNVLIVGAGGIGCELLKNVVLTGFGNITLLDLDTIDLSNLNRQFLFRKKDVKQSKAMIAARTAHQFNPSVKIYPIHANIKDPEYDVSWFKSFDIVLNALDNIDARRHVNKMCLAAGVPLVESGTAGYLGQVQPIVKDSTECFDCMPKPTPKTFPVCTIRSTPSQPIHCIVWAKSYLLPQLFGEDEDAGGELDEAEKQGENAQEIENLRQEARAFTTVRNLLRSPDASVNATQTNGISSRASGSADGARMAFDKVFRTDILRLLSMEDMWRNRARPTALDFDRIRDGTFVLPSSTSQNENGRNQTTSNGKVNMNVNANGNANINGVREASGSGSTTKLSNGATATMTANGSASGSSASVAQLKDQRELSLADNLKLFVSSMHRLSARLSSGREETIAFDKDDDDTLDFVTAAANLRASAYGIGRKTRWEVKEMAGNIIPAIATTNAIVAGLIVLQAAHLLRMQLPSTSSVSTSKKFQSSPSKALPPTTPLRSIYLQRKAEVPINACGVGRPLALCGVCHDTYTEVRCDPTRVTLGEVVSGVLGTGDGNGVGEREVTVYEDKRLLAEPEFEDNLGRTLESMGIRRGMFLTIVDEDDEYTNLAVAIGALPPNHPVSAPALILPSPLPIPGPSTKPKFLQPPPTPTPDPTPIQRKRPAPNDPSDADADADMRPTKRARPSGVGIGVGLLSSPSKKRKLEDDGLVLMDGPEENIDAAGAEAAEEVVMIVLDD